MILLILLIALNIIIVNLYKYNKYFPSLFMLFEIVFGITTITENELYVTILLVFCVIYNVFLLEYHFNEKRN